jgi:transposase
MMETKRQAYCSDLSDAQWVAIKDVVPAPKPGGRPAKYSRREVLNALLYLRRTGCHWRALPDDLPPWNLVFWYHMNWRHSGLLEKINDRVRAVVPHADLSIPAPARAFDLRFRKPALRGTAQPSDFPTVFEGN